MAQALATAQRLATLPGYIAGLGALGGRPAIIDRRLYRTRSYSYAEVLGKAFALQARLRAGAAAGDRVLLWGPSGAAWGIAFYACVLAGLVAVPLDAAFSPRYARLIQQQTGARILLASAERLAALGPADGQLALSFEELEALPLAPRAPLDAPAESDLLEIVYTSGATAEPKGVMITHGNVLANLRPIEHEVRKYERWARPLLPLRFVHLIPLSHLFGQVMGLLIPPLLASTVVYLEAQSGEAVAAAVKQTRASVVVAVPREIEVFSQWARQAAGPGAAHPEAAIAAARGRGVAWRWWHWRRLHRRLGWKMWALVVGGAALPPEQEALWQALGYAVVQGYGLTETAPAVAITHPFKIRRGAVGRKLAGMELRIAEDGEIWVRGPNVSPGYYHNPAATEAAFAAGWLRTGDLGRFDDEGNLIYLGRKKEVIVTADGMNVYPQDVEATLDAQPGVAESAVVGEERGGGARVHAVLVAPKLDDGGLAAAVAAANGQLEAHQRIAAYSRWSEAALPRTASTHKLRRAAVAAWVNGQAPADPSSAAAVVEDWRDYLARHLGVSRDRLRPETRLAEDLGLGSLDRVELLAWLAAHGLEIEETALAQAATVGALEALLAVARAPAGDAGATPAPRGTGPAEPRGSAPSGARRPFHYARWPLWPWVRWCREPLRWLLVYPPLRTVARIEVRGREHLRGLPRPVLFIANHQSMLDVPVIVRALPLRWRAWLAPAMALDAFRAKFLPGAPRGAR
ncbi:MAG: AMP-binding protein, partial [Terriglobales bacterium]